MKCLGQERQEGKTDIDHGFPPLALLTFCVKSFFAVCVEYCPIHCRFFFNHCEILSSTPIFPGVKQSVAQSVKNLPVVQETHVRSLGQEDPLEKEMVTPSSILA